MVETALPRGQIPEIRLLEVVSVEGRPVQVRKPDLDWRPLHYARSHYTFLLKRLRNNLLLGFFQLLDKSLGAVYFVLDVGFEGREAYEAKDIIQPHNFSLLSTPSSSPPRTSNEFGAEDNIHLLRGKNNRSSDHDSQTLPSSSKAPGHGSDQFSKPRRAGIIAERQQYAKRRQQSQQQQLARNGSRNLSLGNGSEGGSCTCWGWEVEEETLDEQISTHDAQEESLDDEDDDDDGKAESEKNMRVRWSECQCSECMKLWMPMSKARSRLHVQTCDSHNNTTSASDLESNSSTRISGGNKSEKSNNQPAAAAIVPRSSIDLKQIIISVDGGRKLSLQRSLSATIGAGTLNRATSRQCMSLAPQASFEGSSFSVEERKKTGVIFLHGIFSSSDFWFDSNIVPRLDASIKSKHLILAPDLLGCGRSPRPFDSVYTLSDQIEALENSLVKKHGLESFHIVGHSMGTTPALALAARFPNRVRSVTLIAPVYAGYTAPNSKGGGEEILTDCDAILGFEDPWSTRALRSLTASQHYNINRFLGHLLFSRHQLLVPVLQRLLQNTWPRSFIRDYLAVTHDAAWHIVHNTMIGGSHAVVPALRKLRDRGKRVFVIHGTDDTSCPFQRSELMAKHFDNVVLTRAPGKGHVDVVLGRDDEVLPLLEREIRLADDNYSASPAHVRSLGASGGGSQSKAGR